MNRQLGCRVERDADSGLFRIENRYGDQYVYRVIEDGERFLVQHRVDERLSNHLYSREDVTWNTRAIRYSRQDAEAWLRSTYSESDR